MSTDIVLHIERRVRERWVPVTVRRLLSDVRAFCTESTLTERRLATESAAILARNADESVLQAEAGWMWPGRRTRASFSQAAIEALSFPIDQNYRLFHLLANVRAYRGRFQPISEARGLPADVSKRVELYLRSAFLHSYSFLYLEEVFPHRSRITDTISFDPEERILARDFGTLLDYVQVAYGHLGMRRARFVFAFDS